jgi:hypothetical protein
LVVSDFQTSDGRRAAHDGLRASDGKPAEIKVIYSLRQVSTVLAATPNGGAAFKGWLRQISQKCLEAASGARGLV